LILMVMCLITHPLFIIAMIHDFLTCFWFYKARNGKTPPFPYGCIRPFGERK
jgi:hypothetical protein